MATTQLVRMQLERQERVMVPLASSMRVEARSLGMAVVLARQKVATLMPGQQERAMARLVSSMSVEAHSVGMVVVCPTALPTLQPARCERQMDFRHSEAFVAQPQQQQHWQLRHEHQQHSLSPAGEL